MSSPREPVDVKEPGDAVERAQAAFEAAASSTLLIPLHPRARQPSRRVVAPAARGRAGRVVALLDEIDPKQS